MPVSSGVGRTTRDYLKSGTASSHDRLDLRLGELVVGGEADYARFLEIQYAARTGIERWLAEYAAGSAPPPLTDLIAQDIDRLGGRLPAGSPRFDFQAPASGDALGVCWVLAGSSLGNRAILTRLAKAGLRRPVAFLSDRRTTDYWRGLRPTLERVHKPSRDRAALVAAQATFAHFHAVAGAATMPVAA